MRRLGCRGDTGGTMFCTKCGAQIPDGAKFCTRCGASLADAAQPASGASSVDDAQPVADPFADDVQTVAPQSAQPQAQPVAQPAQPATAPRVAHAAAAPAGRESQQVAAKPETSESADNAAPANKKPRRKRRVIAVVAGLAIVAAIGGAVVVVPRLNAADAVTSGGKGAVACSVETRVVPKDKSGKKLSSYTAELVPVSGEGKSYRIRVKGDDGFAMSDFGKLPNKKYKMTITSGKGKKARAMTMKVDYNKNNGDAKKSIDLTQSKAEAAKPVEQAVTKTANELFTDKIHEYQKKYGEGQAVGPDENHYFGIKGLAFAKLIDFDGDGQDELMLGYSTEQATFENAADVVKAEVWAYKDGKIRKVYEPDVFVGRQQAFAAFNIYTYNGKSMFVSYELNGKEVKESDIPDFGASIPTTPFQYELKGFDGDSFKVVIGPGSYKDVFTKDVQTESYQVVYSEEQVSQTVATVSATLDQLKSNDKSDDSEQQASYEATTATQDVDFTAPVGDAAPDPSETTQITGTWTYPQVNGTGLGVTKFNQAMQQQVSDVLDKSKSAKTGDKSSLVTKEYDSEIVSIDGDIACVRTYTLSYNPPYRSLPKTRSAYYNLKTGEQVTLEDSLAQHDLSYDALKGEAKAAIQAAKPSTLGISTGALDDDDNFTEDHFYFDGKGYIVSVDQGVYDMEAWGTHDLVAHPIDSSYSVGQDVTPSRN